MSDDDPCLLTLMVPPGLEESLVGLLLEHPQWAARFVTFRAEGHGQAMPLSGSAELVRGRSPRLMVQLVLVQGHARALLERLHEALPSPEIEYWSVALRDSGRLA